MNKELNSRKVFEMEFANARNSVGLHILLVLWLITGLGIVTSYSQINVLIPFREGNLYGLANKQGKISLKPTYQRLQIMGGGYFKYWKQIKGTPDNEEEVFEIGVLAGTKPIIQVSGLTDYVYLPQGIIIGTAGLYNSNHCKFFDTKGKPFFDEHYKTCRVVNPSSNEAGKLMALAFLVKKYDNSTSILIFDSVSKTFTTPLLESARDFSLQPALVPRYISVFSYTDSDNNYHKDIFYYNYATHKHIRTPFESAEALYKLYQSPEVNPTQPQLKALDEKTIITSSPFFRFEAKTLVKRGDLKITLGANENIIPIYPVQNQEQLPILKQGKQYRLLMSNLTPTVERYDSLVYVKQILITKDNTFDWCYLAAKKSAQGVLKWGILNYKGEESVPLIYDSIGFKLAESSFLETIDDDKGNYTLQYPSSYVTNTSFIENTLFGLFLVKKNEKYGLVNLDNQVIVPIEAARIWKSNISIPEILGLEERIYVYQNQEGYGAFQLKMDGVKQKDTGPVFKDIPVAYYPNYMGVEGFDLYYVSKNQELFYGLTSNEGLTYFR